MDGKVKKIKLLRKVEETYINGELSYKTVEENYNTYNLGYDYFLEEINSSIKVIKENREKVLACFDTLSATVKEIHTLDKDGWYITTRFSIIYEGEE